MQEGNQTLSMPKNVQSGQEILIFSPVAYIKVDFKKLTIIIYQSHYVFYIKVEKR